MGLNIQDLRNELRKGTGMDATDLPDADADLYLNRSWWEIIDKFHFREKEVTTTFNTIAGTRLYNMPSPFEALRQLSILNSDTKEHSVLNRITIDVYEGKYDEDTDARGFPVEYVREGCAVRIWPTPDAVYVITQKYWTTLADLDNTNSTPSIPASWHEIIFFGALWRTFISVGDFPRANAAKQHQVSLVNSSVPVEAKEEVDSHRAGVSIIVNDYDV